MDRLRQRVDFLAVADGSRVTSGAFVLQGRRRDDDGPIRIGFTVTKKNGTATERNRIRRRLRELVNRLDPVSILPHHDYVLVGRRDALNRDFAVMLDDLRAAFTRLARQPSRGRGPKAKPRLKSASPKSASPESAHCLGANRLEPTLGPVAGLSRKPD